MALRVGQSEVNGTMRTSVFYYIYSHLHIINYNSIFTIQMERE